MDRVLTIFFYVWGGLFVAVNVVGIIGQFYLYGLAEGVSYIQEVYSPFNITNFVLSVVVLSPAIGAYYWRDRFRKKRADEEGSR